MIGNSSILFEATHGLGLFNLYPILKNTLIYPYTGEIISEEE